MSDQRFTLQDVRRTYKSRDAWWTVFLTDPIAGPLVVVTANRTRITPNQLTVGALVLGVVSAALFWQAGTWALVVGALLFQLSFVLDCMDGKIARLKGTGSILGSWLDYIFDRIRVFVCALALFGGQYRETGRPVFLVLAVVVVFLDMLRYMNAMQITKVRSGLRARVVEACERSGVDPERYLGMSSVVDDGDDDVPRVLEEETFVTLGQGRPVQSLASEHLQSSVRSRFGWFFTVRQSLARLRVRPHVFSGIEFQMFVFVVGPLTTLILPVTVVSAVLLVLFELAIIYKLVLSVRDLDRLLDRIRSEGTQPA